MNACWRKKRSRPPLVCPAARLSKKACMPTAGITAQREEVPQPAVTVPLDMALVHAIIDMSIDDAVRRVAAMHEANETLGESD